MHYQAVVLGGGQSGLATAYYLRKAGVDFVILDDQDAPGGAWRHVWPSMTLFSTSEFSNLPGWPMPPYDGFPPAQHVIDYLAAYEKRYDLPVERPVHVERVDWADGRFVVSSGERLWTADARGGGDGDVVRALHPRLPWHLPRQAVALRAVPGGGTLPGCEGGGGGCRELRGADRR